MEKSESEKYFCLGKLKKIDFIENESDSTCNIIITYNQQSKTRPRSASMYILLCRIKNDHLMYKKTQITKGSRDCSNEHITIEQQPLSRGELTYKISSEQINFN